MGVKQQIKDGQIILQRHAERLEGFGDMVFYAFRREMQLFGYFLDAHLLVSTHDKDAAGLFGKGCQRAAQDFRNFGREDFFGVAGFERADAIVDVPNSFLGDVFHRLLVDGLVLQVV